MMINPSIFQNHSHFFNDGGDQYSSNRPKDNSGADDDSGSVILMAAIMSVCGVIFALILSRCIYEACCQEPPRGRRKGSRVPRFYAFTPELLTADGRQRRMERLLQRRRAAGFRRPTQQQQHIPPRIVVQGPEYEETADDHFIPWEFKAECDLGASRGIRYEESSSSDEER